MDLLASLFDTTGFPPRWQCGSWSQSLGWLHILSDLFIFASYTAIPIVLGSFLLKRGRDVPFPRLFWLFCVFIFAGGTTHLMEALTFYWPAQRLAGAIKFGTALASVVTVLALIPVMPKALALRTASQMEAEIHERRKVEAALRESRSRFHAAFYDAPIGMALMDRSYGILLANRALALLLGYTELELEGSTLDELFHPDDRPRDPNWVDALCAGRSPRGEQLRLVHKSGAPVWASLSASVMRSDRGESKELIVQILDVTAQRSALNELQRLNEHLEQRVAERTTDVQRRSEELSRSNRELEQFAYATSHDLKAPLRAISNLAEWISEDLGEGLSGDSRMHLDLLRRRAMRMERMIKDILEYSKAGRFYDRELLDTGDLARGIVTLIDVPEGFTVEVDEGMPTFLAAKTPLQQVLVNLVTNAIKHHDRSDGRVVIAARDAGAFYELTVSDDGPGIPREEQDRMFGMFKTLRPRDEVEGSGVGLAIVKKIVEQRGGRVWVESESGAGATFHFTWPKPYVEENDAEMRPT